MTALGERETCLRFYSAVLGLTHYFRVGRNPTRIDGKCGDPSCLVLDVALPGLNGLELQKRVAVERLDMPIIFITGYGDVPMTVQAMKAGAVEFLTTISVMTCC